MILAAVLFFSFPASAISAQNAILMDAQTGRVLLERNADARSLIASTTKIMTALIICEQTNVLDRVKIPKEAVGVEGSSMYLQEGEILTVQELLYGLMLQSGNDAAVALAIYCGGTVEGFAQLMNDKARMLKLSDTHFENPHGLDSPGHYSTARDLAVLSAYAMQNPIFNCVVSAKNVRVGNRSLRNHNKLLWRLEGAEGVKTGFTKAAGRILVSSVTRQDRRLIGVTINAPDDWRDHTQMHDHGFEQFKLSCLFAQGQTVGQMSVVGGEQEFVSLVAAEDFYFPLAANESVSVIVPGAGFVYAPVVRDADAGYVYVAVDDHVVAKLPVEYAQTVEMSKPEEKPFWKKLFGG